MDSIARDAIESLNRKDLAGKVMGSVLQFCICAILNVLKQNDKRLLSFKLSLANFIATLFLASITTQMRIANGRPDPGLGS
jgi:hypothetical protein